MFQPNDFVCNIWWRCFAVLIVLVVGSRGSAEDWPQLLGSGLRSGNASSFSVDSSLGLQGTVPMTDAILASPVVSGAHVYVLDGSGVLACIDTVTGQKRWQFRSEGGSGNCNNVAAPCVVDGFVHIGTMAGFYYVLDCADGKVVRRVDCGEPVFAAPVAGNGRVYFATLGARLFCLQADGEACWEWDFVREVIGFDGDRWKGDDWLGFRGDLSLIHI